MFGTIARARVKPGQEGQLRALTDEWRRTVRPKVPGRFLELVGHAAGRPDEAVFVALAQDEATYRALAARPEQDAWYRRLVEHLEAEPTWEDVSWEAVRADAGRAGSA